MNKILKFLISSDKLFSNDMEKFTVCNNHCLRMSDISSAHETDFYFATLQGLMY